MEDLIGCALPARAPKSVDWSTAPDPVVNRSQFAEA